MSSLETGLFKPFVHFLIGLCLLLNGRSFYIFWGIHRGYILTPYQIYEPWSLLNAFFYCIYHSTCNREIYFELNIFLPF